SVSERSGSRSRCGPARTKRPPFPLSHGALALHVEMRAFPDSVAAGAGALHADASPLRRHRRRQRPLFSTSAGIADPDSRWSCLDTVARGVLHHCRLSERSLAARPGAAGTLSAGDQLFLVRAGPFLSVSFSQAGSVTALQRRAA